MPLDRDDVTGRLERLWSKIAASFEKGFTDELALRKLVTVVSVDAATPAVDVGKPDAECEADWAPKVGIVVSQADPRPMWTFERALVVSRDDLGNTPWGGGGGTLYEKVAELGSALASAERCLLLFGLGGAPGVLSMAHAPSDGPRPGQSIVDRARRAAEVLTDEHNATRPYHLLLPTDDLTKADREALADLVSKDVIVIPELPGPLLAGSLESVTLHVGRAARIVVTRVEGRSAALEGSLRESFSIRGATVPICKLYP